MNKQKVDYRAKTRENVVVALRSNGLMFKKHIQESAGVNYYSLSAVLIDLVREGLVREVEVGGSVLYEFIGDNEGVD